MIRFDSVLDASELEKNAIHIMGIPFDEAVSARKGAADGPEAIRQMSKDIETYSPYLNKDWTEYRIIDLGDLQYDKGPTPQITWENMERRFQRPMEKFDLKNANSRLLTIGGDHSISFAPILTYLNNYPNLTIIHLDAHADMREEYNNNPFSHASVIKRVTDKFTTKNRLIQFGIRSGTKEEFQWMRQNKTMPKDLYELKNCIYSIDPSAPIYLTLDVDYFDPAFMPGTGTPEAGGANFQSLVEILGVLDEKNFVGADIVELAPAIDATGNSAIMAAKVTREIMLAMCRPTHIR